MRTPLLYVGTHRRAHRTDPVDVAFGIYSYREDDEGQFISAGLTATLYPGWIAVHPSQRVLYAVNEVRSFEGQEGGAVSAFGIDPETGSLTFLNRCRTPPLPCHCEVDASGRCLLVATFGGGSVHLFDLLHDGRIGSEADVHWHIGASIHPRRQTGPHAHAVVVDPMNRFVFVPDLGTDQIVVYELDPGRSKLLPRPELTVQMAAGSGPRHMAFERDSSFAFAINEISATITGFRYDAAGGGLLALQTVDLLPDGFGGLRSGGEICVHPVGRFLYATTRSHGSSGEPPVRGLDTICWFEIAESGLLTLKGRIPSGGEIPRSFVFDETGKRLFVGHQCSGTVVEFQIEPDTGKPVATGRVIRSPVPVCLCFTRAS